MDDRRFDQIARSLAGGATSRRRAVRGLAGAALAALLARLGPRAAAGQQDCGAVGDGCITDQDCCPGARCGNNGRCRCRAGRTECDGQCVNLQNDEVNCGACGRACPATDVCRQADCCRPLGVACFSQDDLCCSGVCGRGDNAACLCPPGKVEEEGACREANPGELATSARCLPANPEQCSSGICGCNGDLCTCRLSPCAAPAQSCVDGGNARCCEGVCQVAAGRACSCPAGRRPCNGACIENGACCDADCTGGQVCEGGACACPASRPTQCGEQCVNVQTDEANCGRCGVACPALATCRAGVCVCPDGRPACGGKCCGATQVCRRFPFGQPFGCAQCPRGTTRCGDVCRNLDSDRNNCGRCNRVCRLGETCESGACV